MTTLGRAARTGVAAAVLVLSSSNAAWAFRTIADYPEVPDDAQVRWPSGSFEFWTYEHGTDAVSAEALAETSRRAFWAWQAAPCARIATAHLGISPLSAEPGDGINTIEIVTEDWVGLGFPKDAAGANDLFFEERDDGSWAIVEADIYINAEHHVFTTSSTPAEDERSLLGVLTHEAGHALGLLHPCEPDGADDAPECAPEDAPSDLMSPYYAADQLYPETEDVAGICYLYPACQTDDDCGEGLRCQDAECVLRDADGDGVDDACNAPNGGEGGQSNQDCPQNRPTGAECSESNQCEGGECLAGVEDVPICTLRCDKKDPVCPKNWTCSNVEDRSVCIPPNEGAGCDCALDRPHGSLKASHASAVSIIAGIGVVSLLRLRRIRRGLGKGSCGGKPVENRS
jgi:hypothetical protein